MIVAITSWMIAPTGCVNQSVAIASWNDLLRLVVTIELRVATTPERFRRLSSYFQQHNLYVAMTAFGQINRSLFDLRYIDEVEKRQANEKRLNRVELANQVRNLRTTPACCPEDLPPGTSRRTGVRHSAEGNVAEEGCGKLVVTYASWSG